MKSSKLDILKFRLQVFFIKVMYFNFVTYLLTIFFIALVAPLIAVVTYAWSVELGYWKQLKPFYGHLKNSVSLSMYNHNRERLGREIGEKRKEL